jgi:hypothetical protein
VSGWYFWSVGDGEDKRLLDDVRNEYRERFEIDEDASEDSVETDD